MATYKMQKKGRGYRRVKVGEESFEIHMPALIICVVLSAVIWLYIVNFKDKPETQPETTDPPTADTTPADPAAEEPTA